MKLPIYMDHHATTPVDPRVLEAMLPFFTERFGNAASRHHAFGWDAENAVEEARKEIARAIGAEARDIVFTSGATEADNLALRGVADASASRGNHIITSRIEHKAVLDSAARLERIGFDVTYVPVDSEGLIDPADVRRAITDRTILISIMCANNEIGTLQPIGEIGALARERGIPFHTDAVQAIGKLPINVSEDPIDLMSMTAHKIYGPKGIGALYVRQSRPRVRLAPLIDGGGHEHGLRSGTLPVPLIVGFAKAITLAVAEMDTENARLAALRDRLKKIITSGLDEVYLNGSATRRLPNNLNMSFAYVEGESLLMGMKDVALSSGSACTSSLVEPSYVLKAVGVGEELAHSSIRFGLGRFNTAEEVEYVAEKIVETVKRLRALSPLHELKKGQPATTRVN
ncbi:MAG: IscS subfamily cysteine desulfurase [candidate division Zixibacteria bacterium]|nr:IscS subfamily cysteine desulfurase [candidate division Zixibacteria bacterium]